MKKTKCLTFSQQVLDAFPDGITGEFINKSIMTYKMLIDGKFNFAGPGALFLNDGQYFIREEDKGLFSQINEIISNERK